MHVKQIAGKLVQVSKLPAQFRWQFIRGWMRRNESGTVPCALPFAKRLVHVPHRDFYESYSFFSESRQGIAELTYFLARARPGDTVFDVGSFRGAYAVAIKAAFGDKIEVHAFEPLPKNIQAIEAIAHLNQLQGFKVAPQAVGAGSPMTGVINEKDSMLREGDESASSHPIQIATTSIDLYSKKNAVSPTLIKIDVDGFELQVLEGARECLTKQKPRLWLELHPTYLARQHRKWQDAVELIKAAGYQTITFYDDYDSPHRELSFHIWCSA